MDQTRSLLSQPVPEVPVRDVVAAQGVFRDVLGFEIGWYDAEAGLGAVSSGSAVVFLRAVDGPIAPMTLWMFSEDVDALFAEVTRRGGSVLSEPEDKPWGLREFTLRLPDGHLLRVHHDL